MDRHWYMSRMTSSYCCCFFYVSLFFVFLHTLKAHLKERGKNLKEPPFDACNLCSLNNNAKRDRTDENKADKYTSDIIPSPVL
jgi:hypothetical protein